MTAAALYNSADRIIRYAMEDAGLLADGDDPTPEQFAKNTNRLNDVISLWQTQGLKLWTQVDTAVTLVSGQATYSFLPGGDVDMTKPLRAIQGYNLDVNNIRRPLIVLSRDEYTRLSQVTQTGEINSYFVNKKVDSLEVSFWLVPDATAATGTAHVLLQVQIAHFVGLTDTMDFPPEWFMALRWGLADDICTGQPQAIMDRCAARAYSFRTMVEDWDVEDAETRFVPNQQVLQSVGRFR